MSEPFVTRWSRLKREVPAAPPEPSPAFDPTSLPPVETIVAGSDIRPFLQLGVPDDLTRRALRAAWASDPAIRDFVGIAANQWDFNDPAGILGFGPLGDGDATQEPLDRVADVPSAEPTPPAPASDSPRPEHAALATGGPGRDGALPVDA